MKVIGIHFCTGTTPSVYSPKLRVSSIMPVAYQVRVPMISTEAAAHRISSARRGPGARRVSSVSTRMWPPLRSV